MSFDTIEAFALGRLSLSPDQFLDMTPREFDNARRGYFEDIEYKSLLPRAILEVLYNSNVKRGHQKSGRQLFPLPLMDNKIKTSNVATTSGKIEYLRDFFSGDLESLERKDLEWLRKIHKNGLWLPLPKGQTIEGNRQAIRDFCNKYNLTWLEDK